MKRLTKIVILTIFLDIWFLVNLHAAGNYNYKEFKENEIKQLSKPIAAKLRWHLGDRSPETSKIVHKYLKKYGWGYNGVHHYAKGMIYLKRIHTMIFTKREREFHIQRAISEFSFSLFPKKMATYTPIFNKTFLPEVYCQRGQSYMLGKDYANAVKDFRAAMKLDPYFYKSYFLISQCYNILGDRENAEKYNQLGKKYKEIKR